MSPLPFQRPKSECIPAGLYRSVGLETVSSYLSSHARCRVLDLGPARATTVEHFSEYSRRLYIEDFTSALTAWLTGATSTSPLEELSSLRSPLCFDVILAWDLFNYLPPSSLEELGGRLRAVSRPGTMVYASLWTVPQMPALPLRFHLTPGCRLVYEPASEETRPAPRYTKRRLVEVFRSLKLHRSFLARNGMEEHILLTDDEKPQL